MKIDKELLKNKQYKNPKGYLSRIGLLEFAVEKFNPWEWTVSHYDFTGANKILEVGCGTGDLWKYVGDKNNTANINQIYLTDFSEGMLNTTRENLVKSTLLPKIIFEGADVEELKYENHDFDVVLAHLMLYHANSPEKALSEIKRVLKPGGWVGITTINKISMKEIFVLANKIDSRIPDYSPVPDLFDEVQADKLLPKYFNKIQKSEAQVVMQISQVEILMDYIKTHPVTQKLEVAPEFFEKFRSAVETQIEQDGYIKSVFRVVLYRCSP